MNNNCISFRFCGEFTERLDRSKEEVELFRGYYLKFKGLGIDNNFKVSKEFFENCPPLNTDCWALGVIEASSQKVNLVLQSVEQFSDALPAPSPLDVFNAQKVSFFRGPGRVEKAAFDKNGETRYRLNVLSRGFNLLIPTSEELYFSVDETKPYLIDGVVKARAQWESGRKKFVNQYELSIDKLQDLVEVYQAHERARRARPSEKSE